MVERAEIDVDDQFVVDGLGEDDVVDAPVHAIGEQHPVDALVGGVVDEGSSWLGNWPAEGVVAGAVM